MPRRRPPPPNPREVRFVAQLDHPPLVPPKPRGGDAVHARRVRAEHLCLWLACRRALCRSSRHCVGTHATCVFEQAEVRAPLLE